MRTQIGGGVAIYVSIQVNFSQLNFDTDNIEVEGVSVNCQNNKINIVNVFRPPNQDIKFNDYQQVLHNLTDNKVLLGDFNRRSSLWGSNTTDSNGNIIEKVIDQNNMIILNDGVDETIPKTSGTIHARKNCPWWNDDCTNAKKKNNNKRHKHRVYDKTKSEQNHELYKTAVKEFKRITDKAKTEYWQNFSDKLNYKTNVKTVWNTVKGLKGAKTSSLPTLISDPKQALSNVDKTNMLAGTFAEASSDNNLDPTFRTHKLKTEIENPINRDNDEQHNRSKFNVPFNKTNYIRYSVLVYAPSESIRRKILDLNKLGKFQIIVTKFDSEHKKKITSQAANKKEKTENKANKVTKSRVYQVIPKPVDTEIINIKKQESMLRHTGIDIKIVKQLGKAGYLLVTLADKHSQLKSIPLYDQGQDYDLLPYKPNP
ncbi:unnamed protein product [Mytilus coruscus]|uniref:Endonuclease/exonuclease/phosphatase domain-containing protein n=1 Tax=Mytilus coruscus TaxID=42192 RepID=A0A6J8F0C2_MYTCO|nr:unnamed protein product [Mytilus coruscus]